MPTHKQGECTSNVSINLLPAERAVFGRLAVAEDRALGDLIRRLAVEGLRVSHPELAEQVAESRKNKQA